jgi:hypothetical protein
MSETLRPPSDQVITVSCICTGIPCPRCKRNRIHRPTSNGYDPAPNKVGHYPWFWGLRGCDECNARRAGDT